LAGVAERLDLGPAERQRAVAARSGLHGLTAWLADSFLR
jgi:hypothetical protein